MGAWEVWTFSYASKSHSVSDEEVDPLGLFFSTDGSKMYVVGNTSETVYQYTLSTPWDVSTATYAEKSKDVSGQDDAPQAIFFGSSGTKMFLVGTQNSTVYQYTLSSAWDVSTASYDSKSKDVSSQETLTTGLFFSSDGTKMYVIGGSSDTAYQYTLSVAWDVSTASYASKSKDTSSEDNSPEGLFFNSDGTKMYVIGSQNDSVYQYSLSSGWDVSSASYEEKKKNVDSQENNPRAVCFRPNGETMFVVGVQNDTVYQYQENSATYRADSYARQATYSGSKVLTESNAATLAGDVNDAVDAVSDLTFEHVNIISGRNDDTAGA